MAKRKKIGLLFAFDEGWTGGFYYLTNILGALNYLSVEEKPEIVVFYKQEDIKSKLQDIQYPFISFLPIHRKLSLIDRIKVKVMRAFVNAKYYPQYPADVVDFIFPCTSIKYMTFGSLREIRKIYWIPDFQHKYLPHFFSQKEIEERDKNFTEISRLQSKVIVSSTSALNDLKKYYPSHVAQTEVMRFATILPDYERLPIRPLRIKYSIPEKYFMSPNQFWAHKNHIIILKAVLLLKNEGLQPLVLFTGKEHDYRNPNYFDELKTFVTVNQLEDNIKFLGFIDRSEQLQLMKYSLAIIQPSLFEGWSTVLEDAKAMDQNIIASDIAVHREQCEHKAVYFDPTDEQSLATNMKKFFANNTPAPSFEYNRRISDYARQLINL